MKLFFRVLLILFGFFFIRVLNSCCDCPEEYAYFNWDKLEISCIDNSEYYPTNCTSNTVNGKAVGFSLRILADTIPIRGMATERKKSCNCFGFNELKAFSCYCEYTLIPNNAISSIRVFTHYDVNSTILADAEVTDFILSYYQEYETGLYTELSETISIANNLRFEGYAEVFIRLFLTEEVKNNIARFTVVVELADGETIINESPLFTIVGEKK